MSNLPFKLGDITNRLFEVFGHEFTTLDAAVDAFVDVISLDNRWGNDLDKTGILFGIVRKEDETDDDYRQRMHDRIQDMNDVPTLVAITRATELFFVTTPNSITEYPTYDFTPETGRTHPGLLIEFDMDVINDNPQEFAFLRNYIDLTKAAGIPIIFRGKHIFAEVLTIAAPLVIKLIDEWRMPLTESPFAGNTSETEDWDEFIIGNDASDSSEIVASFLAGDDELDTFLIYKLAVAYS